MRTYKCTPRNFAQNYRKNTLLRNFFSYLYGENIPFEVYFEKINQKISHTLCLKINLRV